VNTRGKYIIWTCMMHPQTLLYWVQKDIEPNIEKLYDPAKQHRAEYLDYLNPINKKYAHLSV
jgi:hypothetical protein